MKNSILLVNLDKGWGGGQEYLISLIDGLLTANYQVGQILKTNSISDTRFPENFTKYSNYFSLSFGGFKHIFNLIKFGTQYSIIHIHREHDLWLGLLIKLFQPKIKIFFSQHICPSRNRFIFNFIDAISCNSEWVKDIFVKLNKPKLIVNIISPCIELPNNIESVDLIGNPKILMTGTFYKNQTELITIFNELIEDLPEAHLYLISPINDSERKDELNKQIKSLKLEKQISLITGLKRLEYLKLLKSADILVSTYDKEGFGMALLEAAFLNKPIITYNQGGSVELLQDYAILIEPKNTALFKTELLKVSKNLEGYSESRKEKSEYLKNKFNKQKFIQSHLEIYNKLIEN